MKYDYCSFVIIVTDVKTGDHFDNKLCQMLLCIIFICSACVAMKYLHLIPHKAVNITYYINILRHASNN
jgi:hypothetical protein